LNYSHSRPYKTLAKYTIPVAHSYYVTSQDKGNDLVDLIGVHTGWLPREQRSDDPAQAMLVEKADLAKMTVGSLLYQIIQRERMKDENLRRIAYQEVAIDGEILRLEDSWTADNGMMGGL